MKIIGDIAQLCFKALFLIYFKAIVTVQSAFTAQSLFRKQHITHREPLKTPEEIEQFAHEQAERFYTSGWTYLLLKASIIGPKQQVTEAYYSTFMHVYKASTQNIQNYLNKRETQENKSAY